MAIANSPTKRVKNVHNQANQVSNAVSEKRRMAQPRGGRRPGATNARRPPNPPSQSLSNQKQLPTFPQTNGTGFPQSNASPFGQQQQSASQSFPPFGHNNASSSNAGSSSSFTPPSSSFSFGTGPSINNPFSTVVTQGKPSFLQTVDPDILRLLHNEQFQKSLHYRPQSGTPVSQQSWDTDPMDFTMCIDDMDTDDAGARPAEIIRHPIASDFTDINHSNTSQQLFDELMEVDDVADDANNDMDVDDDDTDMDSDDEDTDMLGLRLTSCSVKETNDVEMTDTPGTTQTGFQFSNPSQPASTIFANVGGSAQAKSPFGQPSASTPAPQQNIFGQPSASAQLPQPSSSFGSVQASTSTPAPQQNIFGQPSASTQPPQPSSSFGPAQASTTTPAPQQQSTPFASAFAQIKTSSLAQPQQNASSSNLFGQANTQSQQNTPVANIFGQANTSTPTNPQKNLFGQSSAPVQQPQTSSSIFSLGQANTSTSTNPQQSTLFGTPFGQPKVAAQPNTSSNSDTMMSSPEKKANSGLGNSLFDAFKKPATDTSASHVNNVVTKTLFNRVEKPAMDTSSSPATTSTAPPPPFAFNQTANAFPTTSFQQNGQSLFKGVSGHESPQLVPAADTGSKPSEPTAQNTAASASLPKFASNTLAIPGSTRMTGGIFGTMTNQEGRNTANPFLNSHDASNAQSSGDLLNASKVNHEAGEDLGKGVSNSTEVSSTFQTQKEVVKKGSSNLVQSTNAAHPDSSQEFKASSRLGHAPVHLSNANDQRIPSRRDWPQPVRTPPNMSEVEKEQYTLAYKLKGLDYAANRKLKALYAANDMKGIIALTKFFEMKEQEFIAAHGWSLKRSHNQQDDNLLPSDDSPRKRARLVNDQQVSYPALPDATPNSNTSSMFKTIVNQSNTMTNGEPTTQSTGPAPQSLTTTSSVLGNSKSSSTELAPNPFANAIAGWRRDGSTGLSNPTSVTEKSANKAPDVFVPKAVTTTTSPSIAPGNSVLKPPVFAQVKSNDFMKQFGQSSKDLAKKEMEKRKAEDMDSDENEAEWEQRDAEAQLAKKQKLELETSKLKPIFTPGQGFTFKTAGGESETSLPSQDAKQRAIANASNPFAHFAKQDSGNEGSKSGDADDEQDGSDDDDDKQVAATNTPSAGSLFDRITAPSPPPNNDASSEHPLGMSSAGINMFGQTSGAVASVPKFNSVNKPNTPAQANIFGKLSTSTPTQNVFGTPTSTSTLKLPGSAEKGDNTWKPESPIKFGSDAAAINKKRIREEDDTDDGRENAKRADNKVAPSVNIIASSPSKATSSSSMFGTGLGASSQTPTTTVAKPSVPTPAGALAPSFGFGISPLKPGPALGSLFPPSATNSNGASRSNSPGATTGESAAESTADGEDEQAEKHDQLNLSSSGPGEEEEEVLHEVRAKASVWQDAGGEKGTESGWETKGLGPFRILKHRETHKTRMLMRSDPTGRVILNSSLIKGLKYDAPSKTTCRLPMLSESGKIENWVIKVGKGSDAETIAKILEENKDQD